MTEPEYENFVVKNLTSQRRLLILRVALLAVAAFAATLTFLATVVSVSLNNPLANVIGYALVFLAGVWVGSDEEKPK